MESKVLYFLMVISLIKYTHQQEWIPPSSSIQTFPSLWNTNSNTNRAKDNQKNTWENQENSWKNQENTWENQENTWNNEGLNSGNMVDTTDRLPRWNPVTDPPQRAQSSRNWRHQETRPWGRNVDPSPNAEVWRNKPPIQSDHSNYQSQMHYPRDNHQSIDNWNNPAFPSQGWDSMHSQTSSNHRTNTPESSWQSNSNNYQEQDSWIHSNNVAINRDRNIDRNSRFVKSLQPYHFQEKKTYQNQVLRRPDSYIISSTPQLERYAHSNNEGGPAFHLRNFESHDVRGSAKEVRYIHSPHSVDESLRMQSNKYFVSPPTVELRYQRHQQPQRNSVQNMENKAFQPAIVDRHQYTDRVTYVNSPSAVTSLYQRKDNNFPLYNREPGKASFVTSQPEKVRFVTSQPERASFVTLQTQPRQNRQINVIHRKLFDNTHNPQSFNVLPKSIEVNSRKQHVRHNKDGYINPGTRQLLQDPPPPPDQQIKDLPTKQHAGNHRYVEAGQPDALHQRRFGKSSTVHEKHIPSQYYNVGHAEQMSPEYKIYSSTDQRQHYNIQQDIPKIQSDIRRRTSVSVSSDVNQERGNKRHIQNEINTKFNHIPSESIPIVPYKYAESRTIVDQHRTDIFPSSGNSDTQIFGAFPKNPSSHVKQSKESFKNAKQSNDTENLLQKLIRIKQLAESKFKSYNMHPRPIPGSQDTLVSTEIYAERNRKQDSNNHSSKTLRITRYDSSLPSTAPILDVEAKPSALHEIVPQQDGRSAMPFSAFTLTGVGNDTPNNRFRRHHVVEKPVRSEISVSRTTVSRINNRETTVDSPVDKKMVNVNNMQNNNEANILFDVTKLGLNPAKSDLNTVTSILQTLNDNTNSSTTLNKPLTISPFQKDSPSTLLHSINTESPQVITQTVIGDQRENLLLKNNKISSNLHVDSTMPFQSTANAMNIQAQSVPLPQTQHPSPINHQISNPHSKQMSTDHFKGSDISTKNSLQKKSGSYELVSRKSEVRFGQDQQVNSNLKNPIVSTSRQVESGNQANSGSRLQQPQPLEQRHTILSKAPDMRESFVPSLSKVSLQRSPQGNSPYNSKPRSHGTQSPIQTEEKLSRSQDYSNKGHVSMPQSSARSTLVEGQNLNARHHASNTLQKHTSVHHQNIPQRSSKSQINREPDSPIIRDAFQPISNVIENNIPHKMNRIFHSNVNTNMRQSSNPDWKYISKPPNIYRNRNNGFTQQMTLMNNIISGNSKNQRELSHVPERLYRTNSQQSGITYTSAPPRLSNVEVGRKSKPTIVAPNAMRPDTKMVIQERPQPREFIQNSQYVKSRIIHRFPPREHPNQNGLHRDNHFSGSHIDRNNHISGSHNPYSWDSPSPQMNWKVNTATPAPVIHLIEPAFTKYKVRHADGATTKEQYTKITPFVQRIVSYMYDADFSSYKVSDYLVMDRQSKMFALRSGKDTCYVGNLNADIINSFEEFALSSKSRNEQRRIVDGNPRLFFYIQLEQVKYRDVNARAGKYIAGSCGTANKYMVKKLVQSPIRTSNGTTIPGDACPFGKPLRNPRSWHVTPCPMGYCPSLSHTCNIQYKICCPDMPKTTKCVSLSIGQLCVTSSPNKNGLF